MTATNPSSTAAAADVTAGRRVTALRYFDVQLPGYADGTETDDELSIWVAAPDSGTVQAFLPSGCSVAELGNEPEQIDVVYTLPAAGAELRAAAQRLIVKDVPRDGVADALENILAAMENVLLSLGKHMTPGDRAGRERLVADGYAAVSRHLLMRERIVAIDQKLEAAEESPTGEHYNLVIAELGL